MPRIILIFLCLAVPTLALAETSGAESYPNRAVRIVVPFPPGGTSDTYTRILAEKLQPALETPVWAAIIRQNNLSLGK
jgi:tripartite-type tricarboxylate transporter receptor subunit TctC